MADLWHFLKNLREAIERVISRHASDVRTVATEQAAYNLAACGPDADQSTETISQYDHSSIDPPLLHEEEEPIDSPRQWSHADRFRQVCEFARQGISIHGIVRRTGLSRKTVRRYLREARCTDWRPGRHGPSQLDPFQDFIKSWIAAQGRV